MPSFEEHYKYTRNTYHVIDGGKRIHVWMDYAFYILASGHQIYRHDIKAITLIGELFGEYYGAEIAEHIALDHIGMDVKEKRLNGEKRKNKIYIKPPKPDEPEEIKLHWINSPSFYPDRFRILVKTICKNPTKEGAEKALLEAFHKIHKGDVISPIRFKPNLSNVRLGITAAILIGFVKYDEKKKIYIPDIWTKTWLDKQGNNEKDDEFDDVVLNYLESLKGVSKNGRSDFEAYSKYFTSLKTYRGIRRLGDFDLF